MSTSTRADGGETPAAGGAPAGSGRVVTVFRSTLRAGVAEEYRVVADEIEALARSMPGFVDLKTFEAPDGERVSIVVFDSPGAHAAWRDHPEHRRAQALGRDRFYERYSIHVCHEVSHRQVPGGS